MGDSRFPTGASGALNHCVWRVGLQEVSAQLELRKPACRPSWML